MDNRVTHAKLLHLFHGYLRNFEKATFLERQHCDFNKQLCVYSDTDNIDNVKKLLVQF